MGFVIRVCRFEERTLLLPSFSAGASAARPGPLAYAESTFFHCVSRGCKRLRNARTLNIFNISLLLIFLKTMRVLAFEVFELHHDARAVSPPFLLRTFSATLERILTTGSMEGRFPERGPSFPHPGLTLLFHCPDLLYRAFLSQQLGDGQRERIYFVTTFFSLNRCLPSSLDKIRGTAQAKMLYSSFYTRPAVQSDNVF